MTEGLLPGDWLLVGNGRGDVSHLDFRAHVHEVLTEFGPKPSDGPWREFEQRLLFAGGGFDSDDPGSLLDVLAHARKQLGAPAQLVHYLAVPPVALRGRDQGSGRRTAWRPARGWSTRSRSAPRQPGSARSTGSCIRCWTRIRSIESTTSSAKRRPRTCTCCDSPTRCSARSGTASTSSRCRSTCPSGSASPTGPASTTPPARCSTWWSPTCSRSRPRSRWSRRPLSADDLQSAREKVIKSFRPLDPAEVVLGQFAGYRDVPGIAARSTHRHLRRRAALDRQRPLARCAVPAAHRQAAGRERAAGQPGPAPDAGPLDARRAPANVLSFSLAGSGEIDLSLAVKKPGPGLEIEADHQPHRAGRPAAGRSAAALRPAHPRRPARRPVAVHPPGRARRGLEGHRAGPRRPAPAGRLRPRVVGADASPRAGRARRWLLGQ